MSIMTHSARFALHAMITLIFIAPSMTHAQWSGPQDGILIFNADDAWARGVAERAVARTLGFSQQSKLSHGACVDGKDLVLYESGQELLRLAAECTKVGAGCE